MIPVTKTFLPPLEEYHRLIKSIWDNQWLTNRGALVIGLEEKLKDFLNIDNILLMNNGTIPLQIALKILGGCGEIITTPFSYVATTAAIVWGNCTPVFVDIDPVYLTIDESKIERAITKNTTAILATHVFGNPCDIEKIEAIAKKHDLYVIYDAAHCFAVNYRGKSIMDYGDVSTCSFHATKLFHTGEGGALFCKDETLRHKMFYSHNFGHNGPLGFHGLGINAKISELQGAMGLAVLPHLDFIVAERKKVVDVYNRMLKSDKLQLMVIREGTEWNFSYYPVIFDDESTLDRVLAELGALQIFPRRYFYPSLNTLPYVEQCKMEMSESVAKRILCLPLYVGIGEDSLNQICEVVLSCL